MAKKLAIVAGVLVVLLVVFVGIVAMQPDQLRVRRTAVIPAAPAAVFEQVNDFHHWQAWSPWAKLDPNAKNSFEGPESGKGAIFRWSGNNDVGEGSMTLLESVPNEKIHIKLDFVRPFEDSNDVLFIFAPKDEQTEVTWTMEGKHNFVSKAMCLFMDMDKMIGDQFEKGLANLSSIVQPPKTN